MSASKLYAHAQYGKLVLAVVLVLRSKGPYYLRTEIFIFSVITFLETIISDSLRYTIAME